MSTEFNPATFEHEGVVYEAQPEPSPFDCDACLGCSFYSLGDCCHPDVVRFTCLAHMRPDRKPIIWVRAQEGKKP